LQEEIVKAEVQETVMELLQNVEIRNMVEEEPEILNEIIEAAEEKAINEISLPVADVKKKKKLTFGEMEDKIREVEREMENVVKHEKPLMLERAKKALSNSTITRKFFSHLVEDFINKSHVVAFWEAPTANPTPENRYVFQRDGFISKEAADKYHELKEEVIGLRSEYELRKEQNRIKRGKPTIGRVIPSFSWV